MLFHLQVSKVDTVIVKFLQEYRWCSVVHEAGLHMYKAQIWLFSTIHKQLKQKDKHNSVADKLLKV